MRVLYPVFSSDFYLNIQIFSFYRSFWILGTKFGGSQTWVNESPSKINHESHLVRIQFSRLKIRSRMSGIEIMKYTRTRENQLPEPPERSS